MTSKQPKISIPFEPLDLVVLAPGAVAAVLLLVATATYWPELPGRVPTHFNFAGEADGWGPKGIVLLLPGLGLLLFGIMAWLSRYPHIYNYPWKISAENAPAQYRCARRLILALGSEIAWLMLWIEWGTIRVARGAASGLGAAFLFIWLAVMIASIAAYFVNAARSR